jgi:hypothetical protein
MCGRFVLRFRKSRRSYKGDVDTLSCLNKPILCYFAPMFLQARSHLFCFLLLLVVAAPLVSATQPRNRIKHQSPPSSAYVRQSDGAFVTDNNQFEFANVLYDDGSGYIRLLLLKNVHNEHIDGHEETNGRIEVEAWTLSGDNTRTSRWKFNAVGNDGGALSYSRFFRVSEWGCCDWPTVYSYFSLLSGKKLYVSNGDLLEVVGTEGGPQVARYVAFGVYAHKTPPSLQFGTDTRLLERYSLISPRESDDGPNMFLTAGGISDRSLLLPGTFNFSIVLKYRDGLELRFPVQEGVLQLEKVSLPAGFTLRRESTDWAPLNP